MVLEKYHPSPCLTAKYKCFEKIRERKMVLSRQCNKREEIEMFIIVIIIIALLILDKETVLCICFCRMLPASVIVKVFKAIITELFIRNKFNLTLGVSK